MAPSVIDVVEESPIAVSKATNNLQQTSENTASIQWKNPSLQVTAQKTIKLVEAPLRKPSHGEVLVHVKATGICG